MTETNVNICTRAKHTHKKKSQAGDREKEKCLRVAHKRCETKTKMNNQIG